MESDEGSARVDTSLGAELGVDTSVGPLTDSEDEMSETVRLDADDRIEDTGDGRTNTFSNSPLSGSSTKVFADMVGAAGGRSAVERRGELGES
jgi:hypothetical protein